MSYCRFSCDDWRSAVYVYKDVSGGFTIHTASSRIKSPPEPLGPIPYKNPIDSPEFLSWFGAYKAQLEYVSEAERVTIDLPSSGQTFNLSTAGDCAQKLIELREEGFHIPSGVIEILQEEDRQGFAERAKDG